MADKAKNSEQDLFSEMGMTPPIHNTNNNKVLSIEGSMQQEDQETNSKPEILVDPDHRSYPFRLMEIIGTSPNDKLPIYTASYMALQRDMHNHLTLQDTIAAVKFVDINGEPEVCRTVRRQVHLNDLVPHHHNILGIRNPFVCDGYLCVVFPFLTHGSLRKIVSTRSPKGLQEDYVVLGLKAAVTGLCIIHGTGHVHGEINAGRIYFDESLQIMLAFSASVYDESQTLSCSSKYLPLDSICKWGAAPEVYDSDNKECTAEGDIWLIGITALELAYGGVKVANREELESIVMKINKKKKLPRGEFAGGSKWSKNKFTPWIKVFSKEFERMVVRCLAWRPADRPTADELLQDEVFADKNCHNSAAV